MGDELEKVLLEWKQYLISQRAPEASLTGDKFLFRSRTGSHYTVSGFRSNFKRFLENNQDRFTVKDLCHHSFRHAYATNMLDASFNLREIQESLGHSDIKTTMQYIGTDKIQNRAENAKRYETHLANRNQEIERHKASLTISTILEQQ